MFLLVLDNCKVKDVPHDFNSETEQILKMIII